MPYVNIVMPTAQPGIGGAPGVFQMPLIDSSNITRKWLDVDYTPIKPHPARLLDIYLPEESDGPFPTIIAIHGGAFWGGSKNDFQVAAYFDFIPRGYALVSVEQRLCDTLPDGGFNPEGRFPNPIHDFRAAIRFCRANAAKYKLDPTRFVTAGGSAGGYHSIFGAVQPNNPALYDSSLGWADIDGSVQAVVDWFGVGNLTAQSHFSENGTMAMPNFADIFLGANARENEPLALLASPETWVTSDIPPVYLQHGKADEVVPIACSEILAKRIAEVAGSDRVVFDAVDGYTHGDPGFNKDENIEKVAEWLAKVLK